jgi:hypothetical protein
MLPKGNLHTNMDLTTLPNEEAESYEVLSRDIHDAINKGEPTLVLDRLHTYSVHYLRDICRKHDIPVADNKGNYFPLHSLAGSLVKSIFVCKLPLGNMA